MKTIITEKMLDAILETEDIVKDSCVVMDFDTTGYKPSDSIVEIVLMDYDGEMLYHSLVNPLKPIPKQASLINGITDDMVKDAPYFEQIVDDVLKVIGDRTIIFWNADFGRKIFCNELVRAKRSLPPKEGRWFCPMLWYHKYVLNEQGRWPKLLVSLTETGGHYAETGCNLEKDCRAVIHILHALLDKVED